MVGKTFINSKIALPIILLLFFGLAKLGGDGRMVPLILSSDKGEWLEAPWSLASYGLVHTGWLHVGVNVLLLLWLSLSHCVGVREYWILFVVGVILGGLLFIIGGDGVLMGASSGIAAIVPVEIFRRFGKKWGLVLLVFWIVVFEFVIRSTIGDVVQSLHLVGYLAGLFYLLNSWSKLSALNSEHTDLIEKVRLSGYQSLNRVEREQIKQMGI